MRLQLKDIILILTSCSLIGCSTSVKLINKSKTKFGNIKFFSEKISRSNPSIKRFYAAVKTDGNNSYYSFYPDKIVKTTNTAKTLIYTVFYGQLELNYDKNSYQKFSALDSIVLTKGETFLNSLGLHNFKTSKGAESFQIEVNYYHGPDHKRFRP